MVLDIQQLLMLVLLIGTINVFCYLCTHFSQSKFFNPTHTVYGLSRGDLLWSAVCLEVLLGNSVPAEASVTYL